jgi:transcriptional regulator with GAF, ATPase, and Fis domain
MDLLLLQSISLAVAEARDLDKVLDMIVRGLVDRAGLALARIWLLEPPHSTTSSQQDLSAPGQNRELVLAASAGFSQVTGHDWTGVTGEFRRFPLGFRKIGQIGATAESLLLSDLHVNPRWLAHPEWASREQICVFAGHPLLFRGEVLGVLGVFGRRPISQEEFGWLRLFADHAAVAIANARAFEQINTLRERLEQENEYLRGEVQGNFGGIIGESAGLKEIEQQIELVARTATTVLILGESGTGKELVARAIHERSDRASRPLVKVNCASVPRELFESEFFGHAKGAFTGALKDRVGRFQLADRGTLFLDEVGEIPLELQGKLLRVLQEQEFERVGEDHSRRVDVRVIAATNRNLRSEVAAGRFREDLYFRISVFPLVLPPLRDRKEDIPLLAAYFIGQTARRLGRSVSSLTITNIKALQSYSWPGNVRELQNVLERALILSRGGTLNFDLPDGGKQSLQPEANPLYTRQQMLEAERRSIEAALNQAGGKIYGPDGAAERLGIRPTTLTSKISALGIKRQKQKIQRAGS